MGYVDDEVKLLQGVVAKLEARIKALEERQLGGPSQRKTAEEIRMILMGPPGAGM